MTSWWPAPSSGTPASSWARVPALGEVRDRHGCLFGGGSTRPDARMQFFLRPPPHRLACLHCSPPALHSTLSTAIMDELSTRSGFTYEVAKADSDEKAIRHEDAQHLVRHGFESHSGFGCHGLGLQCCCVWQYVRIAVQGMLLGLCRCPAVCVRRTPPCSWQPASYCFSPSNALHGPPCPSTGAAPGTCQSGRHPC